MKRLVWKFGIGIGILLAIFMGISIPGMKDSMAKGTGEIWGYASMIVAFSVIFLAVRAYRDNLLGGTITFSQAFQLGLFITLIASSIYVIAWMILSGLWYPDFMHDYAHQMITNLQESGATAEEISRETEKMEKFMKLAENPFFKAGITFAEPLPVGLILSLISAFILKKST